MRISKIDNIDMASKTLLILGKHFFSGNRLDKFIDYEKKYLQYTKNIDISPLMNFELRRITNIWVITENKQILGAMTLNFYLWESIENQYFFYTDSNNHIKISHIVAKKFKNIIDEKIHPVNKPTLSIELGYYAINNEFRGKGYGRLLFNKFIQEVESLNYDGKIAFVTALGYYALSPMGEQLIQYLINENVNNENENTFLKPILEELNFPPDLFKVGVGSSPTSRFAYKSQFTSLGFSKHLGQTWGKYYL